MAVFKQNPQGGEKLLKIADFANFQSQISWSLKVVRKRQLYEKVSIFYCKKSWFLMIFKLWSNNHEMSYKVCRSVLGIQRDYFRSEIIFLTTSGQMAGHILKNQKSTKSLKNRFWPKIQNLVEWPIVAGMMIYGRKWVLKVF